MATPYDDLTNAAELDSRTWLAVMKWANWGLRGTEEALRRRGVDEREADFYRGQASTFLALLEITTKRNAIQLDEAKP